MKVIFLLVILKKEILKILKAHYLSIALLEVMFIGYTKKTGEYIKKRPRIRFLEIISNEPENNQKKLF